MKQLTTALLLFVAATTANAATIELTVNGLVCGFCAQGIEKTFRKNAATEDVFVSLESRLVAISTKQGTDISDDELRTALKNAGYDVKAISRTDRSIASLRENAKARQ